MSQEPSGDGDHGWMAGPLLDELPASKPMEFIAGGAKVLLVPTREGLRAYRNSCAHQGLPLDGGLLDQENDSLVCPWHGFQFCASTGECLSAPQCQLEPFPLRVIDIVCGCVPKHDGPGSHRRQTVDALVNIFHRLAADGYENFRSQIAQANKRRCP